MSFSNDEQMIALDGQVGQAFQTMLSTPESLGAANPDVYAPFLARNVAKKFAEVLNRVVQGSSN